MTATLTLCPDPPHPAPAAPAALDLEPLVARAAGGDLDAWAEIIRRFAPMVRRVARGFRLCDADAEDVAQVTWLALLDHIGRLRRPEALAGWLATTARRESLRVLQGQVRESPTGEVECHDEDPSPEALLLAEEHRQAVRRVVDGLGPRRAALVQLLIDDSAYAEIAHRLDMPVGSIGPTWGRCAERLRRDGELAQLRHDA